MKVLIDIPDLWYESIMNGESDALNAAWVKRGKPVSDKTHPCDLCKWAGTVDDTICKGCPAQGIDE